MLTPASSWRLAARRACLGLLLPAGLAAALLSGCGERQPDLTSPSSRPVSLRVKLTGADALDIRASISYAAKSPDCRRWQFFASGPARPFYQTRLSFKQDSSREVSGRLVFPAASKCDWQPLQLYPLFATIEGRHVNFDVFPVFAGRSPSASPEFTPGKPVVYGCANEVTRFGKPIVYCRLGRQAAAPLTLTFDMNYDI